MKLYKLTDQRGQTYGGCQWGTGITHKIAKENQSKTLCSQGVLHAYKNKNLALLLNPNHANIRDPQLWQAEGEIACEDWGKVGCWKLTTVRRLPIPKWYQDEARRAQVVVMFGMLCAESALSVFQKACPNDDRPRKAIEAAREYLKHPSADAAANAAAYAADIDFCKLADKAAKKRGGKK